MHSCFNVDTFIILNHCKPIMIFFGSFKLFSLLENCVKSNVELTFSLLLLAKL